MHKKRRKAYRNLINALLNCDEGEEWQLLEEHSELLDAHFIQLMQKVAEELEEKGDEEGADFFWYLANVPLDWARTQNNLASAYITRITGEKANNLEKAISCCENALQVYTHKAFPDGWADSQIILGEAYRNRIKGEKADNLEKAISCCENALQVCTRKVFSDKWAGTQNNLAAVYHKRIKGDKAENLENAITCYQNALQIHTHEAFPYEWARIQNNLGLAYVDRIKGEKADNLEKAIICYQNALQIRTREAFPEDWAMTQNNLGAAYSERIEGDRRENLENAITCYQLALQEWRQDNVPLDWAMTQVNLGAAYSERIEGDRRENLEKAISCCELALQEWRQDNAPLDWARTQSSLASAYRERIAGDRRENLEKAISCYELALQERRQDNVPLDWARTQHNLGLAYGERIAGDRRENLEKAISCCELALQEWRQDNAPLDWAMTQNILASAYRERIAGDRRENLEQAIACYELALQEWRQDNFPLSWAGTQNNLAGAYSARILGDRRENLEQAISCYQLALQEWRQDNVPLDCLQTRNNLGNLYFDEENWQQAIESYQIALEIIEDTRLQSLDEKRRQEIIAENIGVFIRIVQCFIELKRYDKAIEYAGRSKTRNLVELITNRDLYPKGHIPQEVLAKLDSLRQEILIETRKQFNQNEIKPFNRDSNLEQGMQPTPNLSPVIPDFTYVNQLQKELDQLIERDINPIDPEFQLTQKVIPISFEEIKALIDADTAIIEWYFTDREILTFITTKHDRQPLVKPVSSFDEFTKLMFGEYLDLYLTNKQKWRTQLPSLLSKFAQILNLEEIIRSLEEKYSQITLIPHLYLHLLPLHALPLDTPLNKGGRGGSCLLDHFEQVKYAPSCQLLQLIKNRPPQGLTNLVGIQNPTQDLPYTDIEVETISQIFKPHDDILIKEQATKTALQAKPLEKQHYSHFSCHGYFNFNKPLNSALILAGGKVEQNGNRTLSKQVRDLRKNKIPLLQPLLSGFNRVIGKLFKRKSLNDESLPEKFIRSSEGETIDLEKCLTLGDVFELDLRQCRLVTLSACETAITDIKSTSDEYISLPSGFLFAGACNVVATQWTVNDLSTAILMIKFYQLHKIDGLPVAKAMNEAQKWLRDSTQEVFWTWTEQLKNYLKLKQELIIQIQHYLRRFAPEEKPFTELFYWAAFCAIGK